jgi:anti-anti-sigma regulatory factor
MQRTGDTHLYSEAFDPPTEAAILYAAGFAPAAAALLEGECRRDGGDAATWLMRLELHRAAGQRDAFEATAARYLERFGEPAPAWEPPAPLALAGSVRLEGVVDSMAKLAALVEAAQSARTVIVDVGQVERFDFHFAPVLCALFRTWGLQSKGVILANIGELHARLLAAMGPGPHVALSRRHHPAPRAIEPANCADLAEQAA